MGHLRLYHLAIVGDINDGDLEKLRLQQIYSAGHVGLASAGTARSGTVTSFLNVLDVSEADVRERVERALAPLGQTVATIESVSA